MWKREKKATIAKTKTTITPEYVKRVFQLLESCLLHSHFRFLDSPLSGRKNDAEQVAEEKKKETDRPRIDRKFMSFYVSLSFATLGTLNLS